MGYDIFKEKTKRTGIGTFSISRFDGHITYHIGGIDYTPKEYEQKFGKFKTQKQSHLGASSVPQHL